MNLHVNESHITKSHTGKSRRTQRRAQLTLAEEAELIHRWQTSQDAEAASELLDAHLPFVVGAARKFGRMGVSTDDLVSEGCVGLLTAMNRFESSRGLRLLTYAKHYIHASMRDAVSRSRSVVGGGERGRQLFRGMVSRERRRLESLHGKADFVEREVAARVGISEQRLRRLTARFGSTDAPLPSEDHHAAPGQMTPCEVVTSKDISHKVRKALESIELDGRERLLLERRLMADDSDSMTLDALGRVLGLTRERVRQIEARLKQRLGKRLKHLEAA